MPMGLNVSPLMWQMYINAILNSLQSRKYCEVIMDDLLLFTPSKRVHMDKLEDLLKALRKNGLKISPKRNVSYLRQKCNIWEILYLCKSFAGMVNFVSIFCPDLQKLLKPIYDLTRKGRQFVWGKEQQDAFEEIKHRLQKPPVLHMPDKISIIL